MNNNNNNNYRIANPKGKRLIIYIFLKCKIAISYQCFYRNGSYLLRDGKF